MRLKGSERAPGRHPGHRTNIQPLGRRGDALTLNSELGRIHVRLIYSSFSHPPPGKADAASDRDRNRHRESGMAGNPPAISTPMAIPIPIPTMLFRPLRAARKLKYPALLSLRDTVDTVGI
jgi:hypothetical protein